jgi:hypothetical protein
LGIAHWHCLKHSLSRVHFVCWERDLMKWFLFNGVHSCDENDCEEDERYGYRLTDKHATNNIIIRYIFLGKLIIEIEKQLFDCIKLIRFLLRICISDEFIEFSFD